MKSINKEIIKNTLNVNQDQNIIDISSNKKRLKRKKGKAKKKKNKRIKDKKNNNNNIETKNEEPFSQINVNFDEIVFNDILNNKNSKQKKKQTKKASCMQKMITEGKKDPKITIEKIKNIMKYNDDEINDLDYEIALKRDKRTFLEYYISLIKTSHPFIN